MIVIPELPPRHTRKKPTPIEATPPVAPTLVAAAYEPGTYVDLTFDRAVDVAGFDVLSLTLSDGDTMGFVYQGFGAPEGLGPTGVRVLLNGIVDGADPGVTLNVAADNGIVADAGDAAWAGCADVALPFGI